MTSKTIILVAPNVSARMGGEAIKALHIALELVEQGYDVIQVTHNRVRAELEQDYPQLKAAYVPDSQFQVLLDRLGLQWPLTALNLWQLARLAKRLVRQHRPLVVHSTSPISPVLPHFTIPGQPHVIGPLNGNIRFPPGASARESLGSRLARGLHGPAQRIIGMLVRGKRKAAVVLVAGGARTMNSLLLGGCRKEQFVETLDSGVPSSLSGRPLLTHTGENGRFVFVGRLIPLKACDLAIRAVAASDARVTLDIIGDGPALAELQELCVTLGVSTRVRFLGWVPAGDRLYDALGVYRGFVFPSLADANGIAVQEAMMIGVPVICLDWAGPGLLVDESSGILINPSDENHIASHLAQAMQDLTDDPGLANRLAANARGVAFRRGFAWSSLLARWTKIYEAAARSGTAPAIKIIRSQPMPSRPSALCLATRLWRTSARFIDDSRPLSLRPRLKFLAAAIANRESVLPMLDAMSGSALADLVEQRPETLAIVYWPYVCSSWSVEERVASLVEHCRAIETLGYPWRRSVDRPVELLDLTDCYPACSLMLDQARWFMREGQLVLNLFVGTERLFSLAFSLREADDGLEAVVGAVQGRGIVNVRESYKEMTKAFFGLRPRDLLIELFKALCRQIGVVRITAVSDAHRHHRDEYFGRNKSRELSLDYDAVWTDRGGVPVSPAFFELPVELAERPDPPSRKRAMYRQRYAFLRSAEKRIFERLAEVQAASAGHDIG